MQINTEYIREMLKIKSKYNVDFVFCDKKSTGQVILELLGE